jgi:hypothetical protein
VLASIYQIKQQLRRLSQLSQKGSRSPPRSSPFRKEKVGLFAQAVRDAGSPSICKRYESDGKATFASILSGGKEARTDLKAKENLCLN